MVSKKNLLNMLTIICVLFLLLQGSQAVRESLNHYGVNHFREDTGISANQAAVPSGGDKSHTAAFVGDANSHEAKTVKEWAMDMRYSCDLVDSLAKLNASSLPHVICIEGSELKEADIPLLDKLIKEESTFIFTSLPDPTFLREHRSLMNFLGIQEVREREVKIEGIHLYSGFLLGGERIYEAKTKEEKKLQDLDLTVPWYITSSGTETYMNGMMSDKEVKKLDAENGNELLPALIWRFSEGKARVFCVSGTYMEDKRLGKGILSAILARSSSYAVYPVINAQNLVLVSFPTGANENVRTIQRIYGRSMPQLENQIILPQLQSLSSRDDFAITAAFTPKLDFSDGGFYVDGIMDEMMSQMNEMSCELGVSLYEDTELSAKEKAEEIRKYLKRENISYQIGAAVVRPEDLISDASFLDDSLFNNLQTLSTPYEGSLPVAGYGTSDTEKKNLTLQQITQDATQHTYSDDLKLLGTETCEAYTSWSMDITSILLPSTADDQWQVKYKTMFANVTSALEPFGDFERTTLSQADAAVRRWSAVDYEDQREHNTVTLTVNHLKDYAYFLLRTNGEQVTSIEGGSITPVEDGAYLIRAEEANVKLHLRADDLPEIRG